MFLNSVLLNSESWYNVSQSGVKLMESLDTHLMRNIFQCPSSTPTCIMYLDLQCIPVRYELHKSRILFLHNILQQDPDSLVHSFLIAQSEDRLQGDWISWVEDSLQCIWNKLKL